MRLLILQHLYATHGARDLLLKLCDCGGDLLEPRIIRRVLRFPRDYTVDGVETRPPDIEEPSSERTLTVDLVTVKCDSIDAVTLHVCGGDGEVATDAGFAEDLLERLEVLRVKAQFVHERDGVLGVGHWWRSRVQTVQRHERDTARTLSVHDFEDGICRFEVIDDDMEQTAKREGHIVLCGNTTYLFPAVSSTAVLNLSSVTSNSLYRGP